MDGKTHCEFGANCFGVADLRKQTFLLALICIGLSVGFPNLAVCDENERSVFSSEQINEAFDQAVDKGRILGAQLCIGGFAKDRYNACFGFTAPGGKAVDENTLFCIGSCSKPMVAFVVLRLVEENMLTLDDGVDTWLPEFGQPMTTEGIAARAPTIRELLSHRGGIYSQRNKLNDAQIKAIRDFSIPLSQSVKIIAVQPLTSPPGEHFAYSGAGYCVIGHAAERATGSSF